MIYIPQKEGVTLVRLLNTISDGWVVNLKRYKCTCLEWQDRKLPCAHAWYTAQHFKFDSKKIYNEAANIYYTATYNLMYLPSLRPVLLNNLIPDLTTLPPELKRAIGRPRTKRYRRDKVNTKIQKESR
jgi:hypothetical protein